MPLLAMVLLAAFCPELDILGIRAKKEELQEVFDEVWPNQSFDTLRRKIRQDMEITGIVLEEKSGQSFNIISFKRTV